MSLFWILQGCSTTAYVIEQGLGQIKILADSRPNEEVLKDPTVSDKVKAKIKDIEEYKEYFYTYFKKEKTSIYSQTTFLDGPAVTYLVVASPFDKVEAYKKCFLFVGCFPYLGFFNQDSALTYKKKLEKDRFVTYMRPVYAYSTLGHLEDRILSSFFHYKTEDLADLVFHELFHTIFFIKDEVSLNENLASFIAEKLIKVYFKKEDDPNTKKKVQKKQKFYEEVSKLIGVLNSQYKEAFKDDSATKKKANEVLNNFLEKDFKPGLSSFCQKGDELRARKSFYCQFLKRPWNNASFLAYATYREKSGKISRLYEKLNGDIFSFVRHLEVTYKKFKKEKKRKKMKFSQYLFKDLSK